LIAPISPPSPGQRLATRRTKRYGASNDDCHWRSPVHLNLSNSVIAVSTLHSLLSHCSKLQNLSLEGLQLSDPIVDNLALNTNLLQLNLSGCSGFSESALKTLLSSCSRLDELNLSWCYDFTEKHVQVAVAHVSETITQLNLR
ncbi:hypothetical protein Celaphus_00009730, partial [Cervus elaphus hippelaphus]